VVCVDVAECKIINVTNCMLATHTTGHSDVPTPQSVAYVGDFNCQHVNWAYRTTSDGESLDSWKATNNLGLLHNPKGVASFSSHRLNNGTNTDLAFASVGHDNRLPDRRVLGKFHRSQHLIGSAFAFLQVNPLRDCYLRTQQTSRTHTKNYVRACYLRLNNVSHMAVARTMCLVGIKSARPFTAPFSERQLGLTLTELLSPFFHGFNQKRQE